MHRNRMLATAVVVVVAAAVALTACGSGGTSSNSGSSGGKVTLSWWHDATTDPLKGVYQQIANSYHAAHSDVSFSITPVADFTTKMPPALAGTPPDIFQQWGSGWEATQIRSGKLVNLAPYDSSWIGEIGSAAKNWQVDGKQYGVPYDLHVVGFWYRKDLFAKAGITSTPTTLAQLEADDAKLKAHGITPIGVGSKDRWPDAFWYEYFALRECSTSVLQQAASSVSLSAPCFTKAANDLAAFMKTDPFEPGFLGVASQLGAGSSAGMLGTGKAAMELQGDWDLSVVDGLVSGNAINSELGWFPFPSITGGQGDPTTLLGGGDGFSCTTSAPEPTCADFLGYLESTPVQEKLVEQGNVGLPANSAAEAVLTNPALKQVVQARAHAVYIQTYFDTAFPFAPGQSLDSAIANFFAKPGNAQQITSSVSGG